MSTSESMQQMLLRAHATLHPEAEAISELLDSGVSVNRILALYPFAFEDWADSLIECFNRVPQDTPSQLGSPRDMVWRGVIIRNSELHAQLLGINDLVWQIPEHANVTQQLLDTADFLRSEAGVELLRSMGFERAQDWWLDSLAGYFVSLKGLLAIAKDWPQLTTLHGEEVAYREAVIATFHLLLPDEFPLDRPPVRHDTMMFQARGLAPVGFD